jgi:hypothetical protein
MIFDNFDRKFISRKFSKSQRAIDRNLMWEAKNRQLAPDLDGTGGITSAAVCSYRILPVLFAKVSFVSSF